MFVAPVGQILVDEELKALKIEHERAKLKRYKRKKMLASEIAELSFEWDLNDFAKKACEFVLADTWEGKNAL